MTDDARLDNLAASWRLELRAEGNAERTIALYDQSLRFYARWLAEQDRPPTLANLNRHSIAAWLAVLAETKAPGTVTALPVAPRILQVAGQRRRTGALTDGGATRAAGAGVPVPILSDDELTLLIKACTGNDFYSRRDEAIVRLLLGTGIRISECAGIRREGGLDMSLQVVTVPGKGSRLRTVPFGPRTARAIDRYLRLRSTRPQADSPALWLGKRGPISADAPSTTCCAAAPSRRASTRCTRTGFGTLSRTDGWPMAARKATCGGWLAGGRRKWSCATRPAPE